MKVNIYSGYVMYHLMEKLSIAYVKFKSGRLGAVY